jgi:predicted ester cyclase
MRRVLRCVPVFLVLVILMTTFGAASAQTPSKDPEGVIRAILGALQAGDAKTAMSYITDDTVLVLLPPALAAPGPNVMQGKDAITKWWGMIAADKSVFDPSDFRVDGNKVTWHAAMNGDAFRQLGLTEPLQADGAGIVENGKLQSYIWKMTPESMARLAAAATLAANKQTATDYIKAFEQGDEAGLKKFLADDFVNHSGPLPKDKTGMIAAAVDTHAAFPNGKYTFQNVMADGDFVTVYGHFLGTHTGKPFEGVQPKGAKADFDFSVLFKLKDGKVVERWATADDIMGLLVPLGYKVVAPQ